jgi:hypothetical protein
MIQNPNNASTVYHEKPWGTPAPTVENQALGPDRSNEERLRSEKLIMAIAMQSQVPPQPPLFRPRFGYRVDELTIADVLNVDILFRPPNPGAYWAGGPAETNSTQTYSNYSATFGNL